MHRMSIRAGVLGLFALFGAAVAIEGRPAQAGPFTPGDILVSSTVSTDAGVVSEYTPTGNLVQTFNVPTAPGGDTYIRGLATDSSGNAQIYNGTFNAFLTTLNPSGGGTYTNHTLSGFSTVNNLNFGGVAVIGNFAYASDMATAGAGAPNGIVRFDLTNDTATRFATGMSGNSGDSTFVGLGLNGLLYAPGPGGSPTGTHIDVIDPTSMTIVRTINLASSLQVAGVAADQAGNIYAVGARGDDHIYKLDSNGNILNSIATGNSPTSSLNGLELSNSGQLLTAANDGEVILSNTSLSTITSFSVGKQLTTFDAFVTPPTVSAAPEPTSLVMLGLGLIGIVGVARRFRK